jgi:RimJ/RimL family protein N-acetyltransferase
MSLPLAGARIYLREFSVDDWPAVHDYAARPETCRFQAWGPNTPAESQAYVEMAVARAGEEPRSSYILAVVLAATERVIGAGALEVRSHQHRSGEIAYVIHPAYWGKGHATEVAQLLLGFAFGTLGLHRVAGTCDPRNTASARVLQKAGMQYEGCQRDTLLLHDGWRDSALYSILEQDHP